MLFHKSSCSHPFFNGYGVFQKSTCNHELQIYDVFDRYFCECVCVCLRLSTAKAVWGPNSRRQIKNCVLKMFLYSAKSLHCYFSMKHRAFLISRFILFTHLKRAKPLLNYLYVAFSYHYQASLSVRAKS